MSGPGPSSVGNWQESKITQATKADDPPRTEFLISTIAHVPFVPAKDNDISSDDDDGDDCINNITPKYTPENFENPPYTTFRATHLHCDPQLTPVSVRRPKKSLQPQSSASSPQVKSTVVGPFINKLVNNGLDDSDLSKTKFRACIILNRMKSLSSRRNRLVEYEIKSERDLTKKEGFDLRFIVKGVHWTCYWYDKKTGEIVDFNEVRRFYKQLKKFNAEWAEKFLKQEENQKCIPPGRQFANKKIRFPVPYRELREYARSHAVTYLTRKKQQKGAKRDRRVAKNDQTEAETDQKEAKTDQETKIDQKGVTNDPNVTKTKVSVYMSFVDSDTVNFNKIYSAYLRIVKDCWKTHGKVPTVMSTGYEFPRDDEMGPIFQLASRLDRMTRVVTARRFPQGVYYPEPNTCILVPPENAKNSMETFDPPTHKIPETLKNVKSTAELPTILKKVRKRDDNPIFLFSGDNPLITAIPDRVRVHKKTNKALDVTPEFPVGFSPTKEDLEELKNIAQSHYNEETWSRMLFVNGAVVRQPESNPRENLLKHVDQLQKNCKNDQLIANLTKLVGSELCNAIMDSMRLKFKHDHESRESLTRTENEDKLIQLLKDVDATLYNAVDKLHVLTMDEVLELMMKKKEEWDIDEALRADPSTFDRIFEDDINVKLLTAETDLNDMIRAYEGLWWSEDDDDNFFSRHEEIKEIQYDFTLEDQSVTEAILANLDEPEFAVYALKEKGDDDDIEDISKELAPSWLTDDSDEDMKRWEQWQEILDRLNSSSDDSDGCSLCGSISNFSDNEW